MEAFQNRVRAAELVRGLLDRITQTLDGMPASSSTASRKRMILHNAFEYACELGILETNPLDHVRWKKPRVPTGVDPRLVVNPEQARRFLAAVEAHSERGRMLKAFFACMYYAALRPEEATELRPRQLTLPSDDSTWGELRIHETLPRSGSRWTDTGEVRQRSSLKHRADGDSRAVPIHPELVAILRAHIQAFGNGDADRRLFVAERGGPVTDRTYLRVFHEARASAFTPAEAASSLMKVPYSLRHAAVSTWLRTTGDAALVASWAGHSVNVLLNVYARTVDGAQLESLDRIWRATRPLPTDG